MAMKFEVEHFNCSYADLPQTLSKALSYPSAWHLQIPLWQRKYDWGREQFETFFKDLNAASKQMPLRLGTLVLACTKSNREAVWVVDGQQRLRTVNNLHIKLRKLTGDDEAPSSVDKTSDAANQNYSPIIKLDIKDGQGNSLDDEAHRFHDARQKSEFDCAFNQYEKALKLHVLNNIKFHVVLVELANEACGAEISLKDFNRLLPPYFERLNRQAKPLNPEEVFKAKLIFKCRQALRFDVADKAELCWNRAKRLILEPMIHDDDKEKSFDRIEGSIWDRIAAGKPLMPCPLRDEQSRREAFCRLLLLAKAFAGNEGENDGLKSDRDALLDANKPAKVWQALYEKLDESDHSEIENFLNRFDRMLGLFEKHRQYLLVTRSHLADRNLQIKVFDRRNNWQFDMLQLCCLLNAALGGHWFSNDYLLTLLRALDRCEIEDLDLTAHKAVKAVEKELFSSLADDNGKAGENKEHLAKNSNDRKMLAAREWLLWQAYFAEVKQNEKEDEKEKPLGIYREVVEGALQAAKLEAQFSFKKPQPLLPSSTGAAEIEHWVAMRRKDTDKGDVTDKDLDRSANYAFIANGLNQSWRDLTVEEKAVRITENCWPNLQFFAMLTQPRQVVPNKNRYVRETLNAYFDKLDRFWAEASNRILKKLGEDN